MSSNLFTAKLLRTSASGFAAMAASRVVERSADEGSSDFDMWQSHFENTVLELAAAVDDGYDMADAPDAHAVSGFDKVLSAERVRRVRSCLSGVDGDKKRALLLVYFEGLTHQELAGRLDVPLGTAKSWVRRGLHQMGRCLGDGDDLRGEAVHDLLAAEHELGVLPPTATPAFQRRRDADAKYCAAADRWADDFTALLTLLAPVRPRDAVWEGITRETGTFSPRRFEWWHGFLVVSIVSVLIALQLL